MWLQQVTGEGNDNPFQYSCLENLMDQGASWVQSMELQSVRHDLATKQQEVTKYIL